jgi:hypothetical protein
MYFSYVAAQNYTRSIGNSVRPGDALKRAHGCARRPIESVRASELRRMSWAFKRRAAELGSGADSIRKSYALRRIIAAFADSIDERRNNAAYARRVLEEPNAMGEVIRGGSFFRFLFDNADVGADPIRRIALFVRVACAQLIRDYLLNRFLVAQEKLELNSRISRGLDIESRI